MTHFEWTDSLEIGLPTLDAQHKQLIAIFNDLLTAIARGEGNIILSETFDKLKEYTEFHFREEEEFMNGIGYPDLNAHAEEHALLMLRVNTLWRMVRSGDDISPKAISVFLSDWISDHLMYKDILITEFARSKA